MQCKWTERLSKASTNDELSSALLPFLQEPLATYLTGASLVSGLLWNDPALHDFMGGWDNERIPANMSYGSFLHTFSQSKISKDWEDIAFSLLFYGLIEPLSLLAQTGRPASA